MWNPPGPNLPEAIDLYIETGASPKRKRRHSSLSGPSSRLRSKPWPNCPSISGERLGRALQRAGFVVLRQKGSHVSLEKRTGAKVLRTVARQHPTLAKGTLSDVLKQAELTVNQLRELL